jgi:glycosyltransferase involved in cell wall biosynthesis
MRSLHVGNLANVAYGCCKILRQYGHDVTLIAHDERHLMSQPEWDDLPLRSEDFLDEFDFSVNCADFGDYTRPSWFRDEPLLPSRLADLGERVVRGLAPFVPRGVRRRVRPTYRRLLRTNRKVLQALRAKVPRPVKRVIRAPYNALFELAASRGRRWRRPRPAQEAVTDVLATATPYGTEWAIEPDNVRMFRPHANWLTRHADGFDVCVAYVLAPIYALVANIRPYVTVEIGTMRDIPFDGTATGRMLALAYRQADFNLITNPDVLSSARRLGLERYAFCPHPVDEDVYAPRPGGSRLRKELLDKYRADHLLFAPARQNWEVKGNDRYLKAFARALQIHPRLALVIPGWGQEVERSQQLCAELGIMDRVAWVKPMSEAALVEYYQAVDAVLDQFVLSTFGLVTGKALTCGCAVITSYDPAIHAWCFAEDPPLLRASTTEEIAAAISRAVGSEEQRRNIGAASRAWALAHHSKARVRSVMERAMAEATEHYRGQARRAAA